MLDLRARVCQLMHIRWSPNVSLIDRRENVHALSDMRCARRECTERESVTACVRVGDCLPSIVQQARNDSNACALAVAVASPAGGRAGRRAGGRNTHQPCRSQLGSTCTPTLSLV